MHIIYEPGIRYRSKIIWYTFLLLALLILILAMMPLAILFTPQPQLMPFKFGNIHCANCSELFKHNEKLSRERLCFDDYIDSHKGKVRILRVWVREGGGCWESRESIQEEYGHGAK